MTNRNHRAFNEQSYLLYHWLQKKKRVLQGTSSGAKKGFGSKIDSSKLKDITSIHKIVGNYTTYDLMPRVMKRSKINLYKDFLNLENYKISSLVPYVKLYKVTANRNVPFYFPNATAETDITSILRPGASTYGAGIKNFSMKFQGKDPFTRDKVIVCSLQVYLDSAEILFSQPPPGFAPLADLITQATGGAIGTTKEGLSKEVSLGLVNSVDGHEIAADVGYYYDQTSKLLSQEEKEAIKNTNLFLRMTLTNHKIDINADGSAVVSVDFIARVHGVLGSSAYNAIFEPVDFLNLSKLSQRQQNIAKIVNRNKRKQKEEQLRASIKDSTSQRLRHIFEYLDGDISTKEGLEKSRIHYLKATPRSIVEYRLFSSTGTGPTTSIDPQPPQAPKNKIKGKDKDPDSKVSGAKTSENVNLGLFETGIAIDYVFMGDLVESFVYNTAKNIKTAIKKAKTSSSVSENAAKIEPLHKALDQLKTFKIMFGDIVIPYGDSSISVNLADVPVSLRLLQRHFFEKIQQTYTLRYTINDFVEDLTQKIYPMLLSDHTYRDAPNMDAQATVKTMMVSGEKVPAISYSDTEVDVDDLPDFLRARNSLRRKSDDVDYLIVYAEASSKNSPGRSGDIFSDNKDGVYHLNVAKDRGLLKSVSFSQVSQKFRKEALMLESVSLYDELRMPYNANIEMIGNNLFLPGSLIYINPASIGFGDPRNKRSAAARLGLGGYYTVIAVDTSYNNGVLSTSLQAIFTSWADSDKSLVPQNTLFADAGVVDKAMRAVNRRKR